MAAAKEKKKVQITQFSAAKGTSEEKRKALEEALKKAPEPIIQQVTPPDVEKELNDLRARASRSQAEEALRAGYSVIQNM